MLDNAPAIEGAWPSGSTLRIGDVSMTVELVSLGMAKAKPPIVLKDNFFAVFRRIELGAQSSGRAAER